MSVNAYCMPINVQPIPINLQQTNISTNTGIISVEHYSWHVTVCIINNIHIWMWVTCISVTCDCIINYNTQQFWTRDASALEFHLVEYWPLTVGVATVVFQQTATQRPSIIIKTVFIPPNHLFSFAMPKTHLEVTIRPLKGSIKVELPFPKPTTLSLRIIVTLIVSYPVNITINSPSKSW